MIATRAIIFWIAVITIVVTVVVSLRQILRPFVAGIVLAYLLNPLTSRIERAVPSRLIATLATMGVGLR